MLYDNVIEKWEGINILKNIILKYKLFSKHNATKWANFISSSCEINKIPLISCINSR